MRGHFTLYSNPLCGYYYALYSYKNRGKHIPWDHGWGCALGEKTKTRVFEGSKDPPFPEKKLPLVDIYIKKNLFLNIDIYASTPNMIPPTTVVGPSI